MTFDWHPSQSAKIKTVEQLAEIARDARQSGKSVTAAVGSFNILMYHHVRYLQEARAMGDLLVVVVNSDESLQAYKNGSGKYAAIPAAERMGILAGLASVDYVAAFDGPTVASAIEQLLPSVYARGGDYTLETILPTERAVCERLGIPIRFTVRRDYTSTGGFIRDIIDRSRQVP